MTVDVNANAPPASVVGRHIFYNDSAIRIRDVSDGLTNTALLCETWGRDNLGFNDLVPTLRTEVLQLPGLDRWTTLTHEAAVASWKDSGVGQVIASYRIGNETNAELRRSLGQSTHFFWGSVQQYEALRSWLPNTAHHACGAGKTLQALRDAGLGAVQAFPSHKEWQQWLD